MLFLKSSLQLIPLSLDDGGRGPGPRAPVRTRGILLEALWPYEPVRREVCAVSLAIRPASVRDYPGFLAPFFVLLPPDVFSVAGGTLFPEEFLPVSKPVEGAVHFGHTLCSHPCLPLAFVSPGAIIMKHF